MRTPIVPPRLFSLDEAQQLLPMVKQLTAEAVRNAETLMVRLRELPESHPDHHAVSDQVEGVVKEWATRIQELGAHVKGLWLVDFDNGEGFYCWAYPEPSVSHFHGYEDGFVGRMKIL